MGLVLIIGAGLTHSDKLAKEEEIDMFVGFYLWFVCDMVIESKVVVAENCLLVVRFTEDQRVLIILKDQVNNRPS